MRALWLVLILAEILNPVLGEAVCQRNDTDLSVIVQRSSGTLSRRRRYLAFPKGSTFVLTVSGLKAIQIPMPSSWFLALEFDMIWPIPQQETFRKTFVKKSWALKRRHRRELYANLELAFDSRNFPGRTCMLRTICEAKQLLSPPGFSFIEDVLRTILRNSEKTRDPDHYDVAYRTKTDCELTYPCPFSLLKFLLYFLYREILPTQ